MKKLEDIPKKDIFTIPEGYFNKLPQSIQNRVSDRRKSAFTFNFIPTLKYAIPAIIVVICALVWFNGPSPMNPESVLAEIETEDLIAYLNVSDFNTDDLLDGIDLNENDLNAIEMEVYNLAIPDQNFEDILDDVDLN
jgi:hypothetical protein